MNETYSATDRRPDGTEAVEAVKVTMDGTGAGSGAAQLETISRLRASVGDGLSDEEFTHLAMTRAEIGRGPFSFVAFSKGFVTLSVPAQDFGKWYSAPRWIAAEKEAVAREIAAKFRLMVCEPPDKLSYIIPPPDVRHHIELTTQWETVLVAHPLYLKVRLFSLNDSAPVWKAKDPLPPAVAVFKEAVRLYAV